MTNLTRVVDFGRQSIGGRAIMYLMPQNIRFFNHVLYTLEINAEKMNEDRELPQKVFL